MPKNIDDVIVPERKRSIRDIPIPNGRKKMMSEHSHRGSRTNGDIESKSNTEDVIPPPPPMRGPNLNIDMPKSPSKKKSWGIMGIALLIVVFVLLSIFDGAKLEYIPKSVRVSFNGGTTFTAEKNGNGNLIYSVVKLSKEEGFKVPASGENQVERKASGTIIVYNTTSSNQRLIENTRFETPEGLIYRAKDAFVIPKGSVSSPGTLEIEVYADEAGNDYSIGLTDFTVPGLLGTSLEGDIYARSKTTMSGGFVGVEKVVSEADQISARDQLRSSLRESLLVDIEVQTPAGFVTLPNLSTISFEDLPQTVNDDNSATLNMRATISAVMFKVADLSRTLVGDDIALSEGDALEIEDINNLSINFVGAPPSSLASVDSINFTVKGESVLVWQTDEVAVKADLAGRHKDDIPSILSNYPNITSATATLKPFWKRSFPDQASEIMVRELSPR